MLEENPKSFFNFFVKKKMIRFYETGVDMISFLMKIIKLKILTTFFVFNIIGRKNLIKVKVLLF